MWEQVHARTQKVLSEGSNIAKVFFYLEGSDDTNKQIPLLAGHHRRFTGMLIMAQN